MPGVTGSSPVSSTIYTARDGLTLARFVRERYWPAVSGALSPEWRTRVETGILPCIVDELGRKRLNTLSVEDVEVWWGRQQSKHRSPETANKCLTRLRHILTKAVQWQYASGNVARFVRKARTPDGRVRWLTDSQRAQLVDEANEHLRPYILGAIYTGARRRALFDLRERDVDLERNMVRFRHEKNGQEREMPLHPKLREAWAPLLTGEPDAHLLRGYATPHEVTRAFKRLAARLKLGDFHFHDLRHDLGTRLAERGENQRVIMAMLGHRDPRMSMRYTHVKPAVLRRAVDDL